ncbi:hypothetical protein [Pontimicrobium sp. MEBiC01747]
MSKSIYVGSDLSSYDFIEDKINQSVEFYFCEFKDYSFYDFRCKELKFVGCFFGEGVFDDACIDKITFNNCYFKDVSKFESFERDSEENNIKQIVSLNGDVIIESDNWNLNETIISREFEKIYTISSIGEEVNLFLENMFNQHIGMGNIEVFLPIIMSGMHNRDDYVKKEVLKFVLDKVLDRDLSESINHKLVEYSLFWFNDELIFPYRKDFFQKISPDKEFHLRSIERLLDEERKGAYSTFQILAAIHRLMSIDKTYGNQKVINKVKEISLTDIHNKDICHSIINLWEAK